MTAAEPETGPQPGPEPEASDLFWGAPTPHDLGWSNDPDLSWEGFQAERDPARIQADPGPELQAEI
jgi:hypothetical protein